jgi:hypothetical protein
VTPASTVGVFFAPNFIQNLYTVLKKRLWESRSTPTLANFALENQDACGPKPPNLKKITTLHKKPEDRSSLVPIMWSVFFVYYSKFCVTGYRVQHPYFWL